MGLFTKREKTVYVDEEGNLLDEPRHLVETRHGWREKTAGDRFLEEARLEKQLARKTRREERKVRRVEVSKAFEESRHKAQVIRARREGGRAGSMSMGDRFNRVSKSFNMGSPHSTRNNANPFGSLFDTGMDRPKASHKTSKKQSKKYAVVGGKAYPIAGRKKSGKKKKGKISSGYGDWDMLDNHGFMK